MTIKITRLDLDYILTQIEMAEAGQPPINPLLSFGLRTVSGVGNNTVPGQQLFGAEGQVFPTMTTPLFQAAQAGTDYLQTSGLVVDGQPRQISQLIASQNAVSAPGADGILGTADDVFVSGNAAAFAAQQDALSQLGAGYQNLTLPGLDGIYGTADDTGTTLPGADGILGTADDVISFGNLATPNAASNSGSTIPGLPQSLFIPNITPDAGLSAPANSFFTFFGQFFDHGLDLISKDPTNGTVFIPLTPDDPLFVPGGHSNFMVLTRAADQPGADGILGTADDVHASVNQITPFVDQSQTYASDPSHQVFLREYMIGSDGKLHSTGAMLGHQFNGADGIKGTADDRYSMATWGDLKANAARFFGIKITDSDVAAVPLLATDAYGNFLPGAHGLPQLVIKLANGTQTLLEGNLSAPVATSGTVIIAGKSVGYTAVLAGTVFLNDMAHSASPVDDFGVALKPDANLTSDPNLTPATGFYDNELLDQHFVAGDGRLNENVGLTAVQDLFHSEHDRVLAQMKALVQSNLNAGDSAYASNWVLPGVNLTPTVLANGTVVQHVIADNEWNGERLFQAAKFANETEYMHIVFDEFARYVAPSIHVAGSTNVHIDPAITSEFANVVYRFGHSMLDENINIYVLGADGKPVIDPTTGQPQMTQEGLIQAFTNPTLFAKNTAADPNALNSTADIILGTVNQISNEIDEFVTGSLQNNLLGLPLDLPALNIARGRDTGVAPLNLVRNQLFSQTHEAQLKAYTSWADFGNNIKHPESLVNFVAAYGTHISITSATTMVAKRAAAQALVDNGTLGSATFSVDAYNFLHSQGAYANNKSDLRAVHDSAGLPAVWGTGSVTGLDSVDLWIGGLAEQQSLAGGVLGSTFEFVFRTQLEALQDGDRLYYLPRIEGMDYEDSLQDSSLAQLIRANTDIKHLPGNMFLTPEYTIEASTYFNANGSVKDPTGATWLHNPLTGKLLVNATAGGNLQFIGDDNFLGNTILMGGTEGNDILTAGAADDDTIWGDGGNDTIDGGNGADFLFGGLGNDTMIGGQGDDTIHGDEGNDTIYGGDGDDIVFGGDGNDWIEGGRSLLGDSLSGGLGNDILISNEGVDELIGGEGDDWLDGRGGQGSAMVGDSGAPTGLVPLYSGNDVMIGGPAGGDNMKGFSGDDIMLGAGSFTKFFGDLGYDWASFEFATEGVDEDLTRKELIVPTGLAADSIRDVFQSTEGASGSTFSDVIVGTNDTKLLATFDELDNVNLTTGLASFFDTGVVSFDAGNILLGGGGNDTITGGGGNDVIDGDAWLHVSLSSQTANAQIIRAILFDANGNTWDPQANRFLGVGQNAGNVDTAVFNDVFADYSISGKDAEGFITVTQDTVTGVNDNTDRIRHIERLQFADITVAIDADGKILTSSDGVFVDTSAKSRTHYDAVPVGTPSITESGGLDPATRVTVGQTLTASVLGGQVAGIKAVTDADGISTPITWQWQEQDAARLQWLDIAGATSSTFVATTFQRGALGLRVQASYIDGKGVKETVNSAITAAVTLPGNVNTAPFIVPRVQFNGIADTTSLLNASFDYFSPFTSIFADAQTASNALTYSAILANGNSLASVGMTFAFDPTTGSAEFKAVNGFSSTGSIEVRVTATDAGTPGTGLNKLSVTDNFFINVVPLNSPPIATPETYETFKNTTLTVPALEGVLANDSDPNGDPFTASIVTGPTHGTVALKLDGSFIYTPNSLFVGTDTFTYHDTDITGGVGLPATVTIHVVNLDIPPVASATPESVNGLEDTAIRGTLLPGTDVDGPFPLTYSIVAGSAQNGTVTLVDAAGNPVATNTTGAYIFTPTPNYGTNSVGSPIVSQVFGGPGSFQYVLDDNFLGAGLGKFSAPKTVTDIIRPVNDGPAPATLSGALAAGGVLKDDVGVDPDGGFGRSPVYTWLRDGAVIAGQTGATYTLTADDVGHRFSSSASYIDGQNFATTVTTATTNTAGAVFVNPTVTIPSAPVNTTLTASNSLTNIFGVAAITGGFTYNWQTSTDLINWTVVPPSGVTFAPTPTGAGGEYIEAVASYVDNTAATQSVASLPVHYINDTGVTTGDTMTGLATADIIFGGAGNDVITGGAGNDFINTGAGNNTVIATIGDGNDIYIGGAGIDTYDMSQTNAPATVTTVDLVAGTSSSTDTGTDSLTSFENVIGTSGNDTIQGNSSANVLTGGAGNDALRGGAGDDTLIGGNGNDMLDGQTGTDTMIGGLGDDTYFVDSLLDVITENAGEGTDTVNVNAPAVIYTLSANLENLNFTGTVLASGTGIEFTGTGNTGDNVITGGAGDDVLNGGGGNDTLKGAAGNDQLNDGAGNDSLDGGAGADTMTGGAGNDTYIVDNTGDVVVELALGGTDLVSTTLASYTLTANVENLTFNGTVPPPAGVEFTGTGNALDNVISGAAGNDVLNGGGTGNDSLKGFAGTDILTGGTGNDTLDGGAGVDTMTGGAGDDIYFVDATGDVVTEAANAGNDTINTTLNTFTLAPLANVENLTFTGTGAFTGTGNTSANVIIGGNGGNTLDDGGVGGTGDKLQGGTGSDTYFVRNAGDVIIEASATGGVDTVNTTLLSFNLAANLENLTFIGTTGNFTGVGNTGDNVITAGLGNDTLNGLAGNDTLIGGTGNDTLTGQAGNDVFKFAPRAFGNDTITDFTHGQDVIDLTGLGIKAADFGNVNKFSIANVSGGGSVISFGNGFGTIALSGVKANSFTVANLNNDFRGLQ